MRSAVAVIRGTNMRTRIRGVVAGPMGALRPDAVTSVAIAWGSTNETPAHVEATIARALHRGTRPLPARLHGPVGGGARGGEREGGLSEGVDVG